MPTNNKCPYVYGKGNKQGEICNNGCYNQFCSKHMPKKKTCDNNKKDIEETDNESIVSTVDIEDENTQKSESIKSNRKNKIIKNKESNDDILITKYFVYDCIRDFFKDYNDINVVLGNKPVQSQSSNMSSILTMAGIGCLPILLKNISGLNIQDALFKQTSNNTTCDSSRLYGKFDEVGNNAEQERTQEGNQNQNTNSGDREIQKTHDISNKQFRVI